MMLPKRIILTLLLGFASITIAHATGKKKGPPPLCPSGTHVGICGLGSICCVPDDLQSTEFHDWRLF